MIKKVLLGVVILLVLLETAPAQYQSWQHSGSVYLLTTPEGANLSASALEDDFPLLVRLHKDFFNFSQAKARGEDIRFSTNTGTPLAYQVEEWDSANGTASVWVRIPTIKGNARQEIKLYWGNADAASESSGSAVFNESNGYLSVWHMNDPVKDDVGTLASIDTRTTASTGMIGQGRRFDVGKGIKCGESITTYPSGASPSSSEAWFRADKPNADIIAWGNEGGGSGTKVRMRLASPPHIRVDSDFADVSGASRLTLSRWIHVVHTYTSGDSRVYVNGRLDGATTPMLAIKSPARMWIGGWYNNFNFVGTIDEARISKVTRSAEWIRLQYENQKPLQTLVGPLVQKGNAFSVSRTQLTVPEGKSATITAKAGGAQKVYWLFKKDGVETIAAVDRFNFTLDAGRVVGDQSFILQFKAVYASEVKTKDIAVTIREDIPEPVFTLKGPAKWDGRETIEVIPQIANLKEMQAKGAGNLNYTWTVSDIAVIKEIAPEKLILKRAQNSGNMTVTLAIGNGGAEVTGETKIRVQEPAKDTWVERTPAKDEKPEDNQFYARDDRNEGTLYYNGTLDRAADSVFLKVYANDKIFKTESQKITADKTYAFRVKLKPGLIKYKVEFGSKAGGTETVLRTVKNLVCGDAYIIQGQSNAEATGPNNGPAVDPATPISDWIRSYGNSHNGTTSGGWGNAIRTRIWGKPDYGFCQIGTWGMVLASNLVEKYHIPICIMNGAVGGTRIDQHQRNESSHKDPATIYGRLLTRIEGAKLTHGIRGVLWHQGENNQGSSSPTGDYDWKSYQQYFVDLSADWKQYYPNIQHYYVYQIWPSGCNMGGTTAGDMLLEMQRTLASLYSNMRIMSTLGIVSGSSGRGLCHFDVEGYAQIAQLMSPLLEQDNYGLVPTQALTAPNLKRAWFTSAVRNELALDFGQPMAWKDECKAWIYVDEVAAPISTGKVAGNVIMLQLSSPSTARSIAYLSGKTWDGRRDKLLYGANGIAALTFCNVPILENEPREELSVQAGFGWYKQTGEHAMKTSMWSIMMISTVALSACSADASPVELQKPNSRKAHSMIKDYGLKHYVRVSRDLPHSENKEWKLVCTMPYNCHFQPWIQMDSPEGKVIRLNSSNPLVLYLTPTETYTTISGEQTYEAKKWVSGEGAVYTIPAGVTVKAVQYRETGYDTTFAGSFECNDDDYNILWKKAARTAYICMRDRFYDCPDRERVGFWGDGTPELNQCFYVFDAASHRLCKDLVLRKLEPKFYPGQHLEFLGEYGLWFYYLQTGDLESIRAVYAQTKTFLCETYQFGNSKTWFDWGKDIKDIAIIETCFYYNCLETLKKMALVTGHDDDVSLITQKLESIKSTFDSQYWKGSYYMSSQVTTPDDRANAMAVNAGLADRSKWDTIYENVLTQKTYASCFFDRGFLKPSATWGSRSMPGSGCMNGTRQ